MTIALRISRRRALQLSGAAWLAACASAAADDEPGRFRLATFAADVTVPPGHGMMGGAWLSKSVADPLEARGIVLLGDEKPIVYVSVDWCEIRNDAYARWQEVLAEAAGTEPSRVLVTAVHQHDAPVADLTAEKLLREAKRPGTVCDPLFHEKAVQNVAAALRKSLDNPRPITHLGLGSARVEKIASNRRYVAKSGAVRFDRTSRTTNAEAIAADEGLIDPWLKTLSFWNGETPLAAISFYAVHPMSYYGQGEVSADFPGLARRQRERDVPGVHHLYCSGASGNVTAGKYNTGAQANRARLADRLASAMDEAWRATRRVPLTKIALRTEPVMFEPRSDAGFSEEELTETLKTAEDRFQQCLAAMGLSWRKRLKEGRPIELAAIDFGAAHLLLLPGEAYVEFQLAAQKFLPDSFVCVAGYGDAATGYIPTERHIAEKDGNLSDWCWVAPGSEKRLLDGIERVLGAR